MIEVMIPSFMWNNEEWVIKKLQSIENAYETLRVCDGSVGNVLLDCNYQDNYSNVVAEIFNNINWIKKIMIKKDNELIGIFYKKGVKNG